MTWVVLVINIKGGTGKSTIAKELAEKLNQEGHHVGVMDADIDSANLASRFGVDEKVTFTGDHVVEPVKHDGMEIYSMENAFEESTFSQSGQFMGDVIDNMVNHSNWGDLDYMVVDCPPGSSNVFKELVRSLRPNLKGAVSVGIPDAVEDTARLIKVCNHNWVPLIGFVENMSGVACHGEMVSCDNGGEEHEIKPFGEGKIKDLAEAADGKFLGSVPLCVEDTEITDVASDTIDNMYEAIELAPEPRIPEDNTGNASFINNVWKTIKQGLQRMNESYDVSELQDGYGVENRDPLVISLKLTDAGAITKIFDEIYLTVQDGDLKPMRPGKAKRKIGKEAEGGIEITSQDLYDAIRGRKKVMLSPTGEITTEEYSITRAVQMGDAQVWGEKMVNRLAVLDTILTREVDMEEVREAV